MIRAERIRREKEELEYETLKVAVEEALQNAQVKEPLTLPGKTDRPGYIYLKDRNLSVNGKILEDRPGLFRGGRAGSPVSTQVIDAYLTYMEDGGASSGYLTVRARKLKFFARQNPSLPTDAEVIRTYLRQFKTADVPTRRDQWTALTSLYKFASRTYGIVNPMLDVEKPRFKKKQGQRLSRDEAKSLIAATQTDLEWALVTCYFGLRFRRIEAERLISGDIKSDYIIVQGKERTEELPLLPVFRDMLLRLQNKHGPGDSLFSIKGETMAYHIKKIFNRAGITGVRASPHTFRNTAGALWSTFGGDWTSNRQLLRHSEKTMTDHYSPLTIDELRVKDDRHNPMLNLMRELGLVPGSNYPNTSNAPRFLYVADAPCHCRR